MPIFALDLSFDVNMIPDVSVIKVAPFTRYFDK